MLEKEKYRRDAEKLAVARSLLLMNESIFVHLSPANSDALVIPFNLLDQNQVVLQIGKNMPVPIPDLTLDDEGFSGTLSFRGKPFTVYVPWRCVFALRGLDSKGRMWEEDVSTALKIELQADRDRLAASIDETRKTAPHLKPVGGRRKLPAGWAVYEGKKED